MTHSQIELFAESVLKVKKENSGLALADMYSAIAAGFNGGEASERLQNILNERMK
jgi:hypothetical protein